MDGSSSYDILDHPDLTNGMSNRFWVDQWVPNHGTLKEKEFVQIYEFDIEKRVNEFVKPSREWYKQKI